MAIHQCLNGTMVDTDKYSNPVPIIGLYTAASTFLCCVLMLCDVWSGFRNKKSWLPCRLFPLNSVTLTLIAIATKLPVDLTTSMPSAQDQLSKLTGTIFICISMGFFFPSIGVNRELDCYANLVALSIFVITVVVNICIQMATGVIFSFVIEHTIILFCMVTLLLILWWSAVMIHIQTGPINHNKDLIIAGEGSILQRLKLCYLHAYPTSPQYVACKLQLHDFVCLICITCLGVLAAAVFPSLIFKDLKFCKGVSDYGWSMMIVVVIQILTIFLTSLAIGSRWLSLVDHWVEHILATHHFLFNNGILRVYTEVFLRFYTRHLPIICREACLVVIVLTIVLCVLVYLLPVTLIGFVVLMLRKVHNRIRCMSKNVEDKTMEDVIKTEKDRNIERYRDLLQKHNVYFKHWVLRNAVYDMERWIEMSNRNCPHLTELFSKVPSQPLLFKILVSNWSCRNREMCRILPWNETGGVLSCLSITLLEEMIRIAMPTRLTVSIHDVLCEVFDIIYFIDTKINRASFDHKLKSMTAKVYWENSDRRRLRRDKRSTGQMVQSLSEIDYALETIREFANSQKNFSIQCEARSLKNFIGDNTYSSIERLYAHMERLFVAMLHEFLTQLPKVLFEYIVESPMEEYEDRVRLALKFVYKLESVDAHVRWSYPAGNNASLITTQVSAVETSSNAPTMEGQVDTSIVPDIKHGGEIQGVAQHDIV